MAGRKLGGLIATVLIAFVFTSNASAAEKAWCQIDYDSTELKKDSIYICLEHYFEWCSESSICAYCEEPMHKIDLWSYYVLLECEDCKQYFIDHYEEFKSK